MNRVLAKLLLSNLVAIHFLSSCGDDSSGGVGIEVKTEGKGTNNPSESSNTNDPSESTVEDEEGLVGAKDLIISPEIDGIHSRYDTKDKVIYFSWKDAVDSTSGIRDYTVHRHELENCAGLSLDTATIRGTSLSFEGEEGKTYSFKVSSYNNEGISTKSDCSNNLTIDTTPPAGVSISIDSGASYVTTTTVALTPAAIGATEMYITNSSGCSSGGTWVAYSANNTSWTLGQTNGAATVYAKFRDVAGNESSCASDSIIHDSISPTGVSVSINSGASYVTTTTVSLTPAATGASEMYISNTPGCVSGGAWVTYSTNSVSWTLAQSSGTATVYAMYRDAAGNQSACISDTIAFSQNLSIARRSLVATTVGSNAIFAGGILDGSGHSDRVDIYNSSSGSWSTATLSQARPYLAATSAGSKALFAGGNVAGQSSDIVDIFDSSTNTWSTANLSLARMYLAATSVGTKAIFAGGIYLVGVGVGVYSNAVDIYDSSTNTWSTATLSLTRANLSATTVGTKAIFAGGNADNNPSNRVDIYDSSTNTWSTATLSQARYSMAATTVGTKAIFAGGNVNGTHSNRVDIYDSTTNTWSTATLSQSRTNLAAATVGTKAIFAGGNAAGVPSNRVDIYDSTTNTWSTATLSLARNTLAATAVGTLAIFAGGERSDAGTSNVVDFFDP